MIKGAVFTLGGIVALVGLALGFMSYWAESMSDAPGAESGLGHIPLGLVLVGIAAIVGAFFIP